MAGFQRLCAAFVLSASAALAGTVLSVTPSPSYDSGVGYSDIAFGWTQTSAYSGVSISMVLVDGTPGGPVSGTEATFYLMDAIGPGATASSEVEAPATVSGLTSGFSTVTPFSGLTLGAGTYYLVFAPVNEYVSPEYSSGTPIEVDGSGVTDLGETAGTPVAFPPAFSPYGDAIAPTIEFSITSTGMSSTPEPSSAGLVLLGGVVVAARRRIRWVLV